MIAHSELSPELLRDKIKSGAIRLGGNRKLKIYGGLHCKSGKRMKKENRVFFKDKEQARVMGYRPCGHCMRKEYLQWKDEYLG